MPETTNIYAYTLDDQEYTTSFRWTPRELVIVLGVDRADDGQITRSWIQNHYKDKAGAKRAAQRFCRENSSEYYIAELRLVETKETMTYWERSQLEGKANELGQVITAIEKVIDSETTPDGKAALQRVITDCQTSVQTLKDQLKADDLAKGNK